MASAIKRSSGESTLSAPIFSPIPLPASMQLRHVPSTISAISLRRLPMSPALIDSMPGKSPGFFTMYAIKASGSPPIEKNSMPLLSYSFVSVQRPWHKFYMYLHTTKLLKAGCVHIRTRCPCGGDWSSFAIGMNGCTSPRDPQICIAIFSDGVWALLFSLMNSSTIVVLPFLGLAHFGGRNAAASL
jgi:hypothetical protein